MVIGGASLDTLHFGGRTERSAGGAGLYTALAAQRAGIDVTMIGPRPDPMPPELAEAAQRVEWRGKVVSPERLPSFDIAHLGGGRTEMRGAVWRAESELGLDGLPTDLPSGWVYCIPLTDPRRQLQFVRHFKARGRSVACGTYGGAIAEHPEAVHEAFVTADIFFCNEAEAVALFGDLSSAHTTTGKLLFVTRGHHGVRVMQGDHTSEVPAVEVRELDPTGAGDTFCGTVLALLSRGDHPVTAARQAVIAAAEVVTHVGPAALLQPSVLTAPASTASVRTGSGPARVNREQVRRIAALIGSLPEVTPFDFTGRDFPIPGDPAAVDFFFAATLHQFGFWTTAAGRYHRPMIASLGGRRLKGSDFLWAAAARWLREEPAGLLPAAQAALDADTLAFRLRADDGDALPALDLHLQQAQAYGRDLVALDRSPAEIVKRANADPRPLANFLSQLDRIGGYKEDPLRKKSALLALILRQRPEGFLRFGGTEEVPPVVDYHVQRGCLRMGLVTIEDPDLRRRLADREVLQSSQEAAVRTACFRAMAALQPASGRSMGAVDWFFFQNRHRCPEMTEPECARCPVDGLCGHHTDLFQPVLRSTFY